VQSFAPPNSRRFLHELWFRFIPLINYFVAGLTREAFEKSKLHQFAIVRVLEIISEATSKVSPEFRQGHPEIPWAKMTSMRSRLIHDYTRVNLDIIWEVVSTELPRLIELIEPLVPPEEDAR
jgi:uncharacterized protein with HEPN domain